MNGHCESCNLESSCDYPYKPCDCSNYAKFRPLPTPAATKVIPIGLPLKKTPLVIVDERFPIPATPELRNLLAFEAMQFAYEAHKNQFRRYTGNPYHDHLAEVVAIMASIGAGEVALAVSWLHDVIDDCGITIDVIHKKFGTEVGEGIWALSDTEKGNRAERKTQCKYRLMVQPGWIQSIKCVDIFSNVPGIVKHDPEFAKIYLPEKRDLLQVLTRADARLLKLAYAAVGLA